MQIETKSTAPDNITSPKSTKAESFSKLDKLVDQKIALIESQPSELHLAVTKDIATVQALVNSGADLFAKDANGKTAADIAETPIIKNYLNNKMEAIRNIRKLKKEHLAGLELQLPNDLVELKQMCMDLLVNYNVFQDRARYAIKDLVEEKAELENKCRIYEKSTGADDTDGSESYLNQLQFWQDETEKQASIISQLKTRIRLLELSATEQEEFFREGLLEHNKQHHEQLKIIFQRAEETEKLFLAFQKKHADEMSKMNALKAELDVYKAYMATNNIGYVADLQAELVKLNEQVKAITDANVQQMNENLKSKSTNSLNAFELRDQPSTSRSVTDTSSFIGKESFPSSATQERFSSHLKPTANHQRQESQISKVGPEVDIVFVKTENGQSIVRAGTIERLIGRLVDPTTYDNHFMQTFLLTYKTFLDPLVLMDHIINTCKPVPDVEGKSQTPASGPVVLKCVNLVKYWIEQYWVDFQSQQELSEKLDVFVASIENPKLSQMIKTQINRKLGGTEVPVIPMPTDCPKPILPKQLQKKLAGLEGLQKEAGEKSTISNRPQSIYWTPFTKIVNEDPNAIKLKMNEIDPLELARQLTLIEYELFTCIKPREFVGLSWMKDDKEIRAPNIIRMVRWSNHVIQWLVTEIVTLKDNIKQRAAMMERIIQTAKHCNTLNNFNAVKEILAALQASAVYRLKKTKEAVGVKYLKMLEELKTLTASEMNYKNLRAKVHGVEPPLIPFPGVYQGDLVFLETCGKDIIENGMVNFQKFHKLSTYIIELQTYQKVAYHFEPVPEIQDMIKEFPTLDEDHAYALSLVCEPRNG
ncbi:hypothetical protein HDV06_000533 [Boothiomyces sp. JEL0866]|nr:hypothetical protein HDV06_000533 [Boothiomyces sp. JEL0866]